MNLTHLARCLMTCRLMEMCRLDERCDVKVVAGDRSWRDDWWALGVIFDTGKEKCGIVGVESRSKESELLVPSETDVMGLVNIQPGVLDQRGLCVSRLIATRAIRR